MDYIISAFKNLLLFFVFLFVAGLVLGYYLTLRYVVNNFEVIDGQLIDLEDRKYYENYKLKDLNRGNIIIIKKDIK